MLYTDDYDDKVRFRARPQVQRGPVLIDSGTFDADKCWVVPMRPVTPYIAIFMGAGCMLRAG